jgi:hypothetical protein
MVVSEIGAIQSPKVAPPRIAPANVARCAPNIPPAGNRRGAQINIVPKLEPVDTETIQQMRKDAMTNAVPPRWSWPAVHVRASTKPVSLISTPMIDANIQAVIMIMTIGCDIPSITETQKFFRSLARIRPKHKESIRTGQNPRSSGAPDKAIATTPARNTIKGKRAPVIPP